MEVVEKNEETSFSAALIAPPVLFSFLFIPIFTDVRMYEMYSVKKH